MRRLVTLCLYGILALTLGGGAVPTAFAQIVLQEDNELVATAPSTPPPSRKSLENIPKLDVFKEGEEMGLPFDIRGDAMKEAALSYGARGGLAWRTFWIDQQLKQSESFLDRVYDFRQLLIAAPSGLLIEPPVISEAVNAVIIETGGETAAVSDRIYDINANAKIVSTARNWRDYLKRSWGAVAEPPDILRPNDEEEREQWIIWVRQGWEEGVQQADETFEQELARMNTDYMGMIRYRMLLAQGMISPPYTTMIDRGITGGGSTMRIGDRAVQITAKPSLIVESQEWQPANR